VLGRDCGTENDLDAAFQTEMEHYGLALYRARLANQLVEDLPHAELQRVFLALGTSAGSVKSDPTLQIKLVQVLADAERLFGTGSLTLEGLTAKVNTVYRQVRSLCGPKATAQPQVVLHVLPERAEPRDDATGPGARGGPVRPAKKQGNWNANRNVPYAQKGKENHNKGQGQQGDPQRGSQGRKDRAPQFPPNPHNPPGTGLRAVVNEHTADLQEIKELLKKIAAGSAER